MFITLVMESIGGWEEQANIQIKRLGTAHARPTDTRKEESDKMRHVSGLGVHLAKGNAALFLNRTPSFSNPGDWCEGPVRVVEGAERGEGPSMVKLIRT